MIIFTLLVGSSSLLLNILLNYCYLISIITYLTVLIVCFIILLILSNFFKAKLRNFDYYATLIIFFNLITIIIIGILTIILLKLNTEIMYLNIFIYYSSLYSLINYLINLL